MLSAYRKKQSPFAKPLFLHVCCIRTTYADEVLDPQSLGIFPPGNKKSLWTFSNSVTQGTSLICTDAHLRSVQSLPGQELNYIRMCIFGGQKLFFFCEQIRGNIQIFFHQRWKNLRHECFVFVCFPSFIGRAPLPFFPFVLNKVFAHFALDRLRP